MDSNLLQDRDGQYIHRILKRMVPSFYDYYSIKFLKTVRESKFSTNQHYVLPFTDVPTVDSTIHLTH